MQSGQDRQLKAKIGDPTQIKLRLYKLHGVAGGFIILGLTTLGFAPSLASGPALNQSDKALYKDAFKFAEVGNWTAAQHRAGQALNPLPRKILRWLAMSKPGNRYSFSEIQDFIDRNSHWPGLNILQNRAEQAIDEYTPSNVVLDRFSQRPPQITVGKIAYGHALIEAGKTIKGRALLRNAWVNGHFSRRDEALFMRQHRKQFTQHDHWERLDNLLWKGHHLQARRMLRRVSPGDRALGIARIHLRKHLGGVDRAIAQVPKNLLIDPGLMYERLRWRRKKGRNVSALNILINAPENMVRTDLWSRERVILARRLLVKGQISEAYQALKNHGLDTRHRLQLAEAEWLAGWIALRYLNDPNEAKRRFERLFRTVFYPVSKSRAAYWAGRAASTLAEFNLANDWYKRAASHPTTYHGQLAIESLGQNLSLTPDRITLNSEKIKSFQNQELVRVIHLLNQLNQQKLLKTFLLRLSRIGKHPGHRTLVGNLAITIGRLDLAVWVARHAQRDGITLLNLGYPVYRIPTGKPERALLLAVARQESNFDKGAISPAGARGIMQLMPRTARIVAQRSGIPYSRPRLTRDPAYNIRLGRRYLRDMLSKFNGSYVLAVAAYNAGANAVFRWVKHNGDPRNRITDPIDWIELIPYQETRTYVQRVLANLQIYRNRLQPGRMTVTLRNDLRR